MNVPAASGPANGALTASTPTAAPDASVLAIQAEPETRSVLAHGLSCLGLDVETTADGEHGVVAASSGGYGLVLLDLILPGHDGFDVLAQIREAQPHLPVIVLTSLGGAENRIRGLEAGAVDYVLKPFSLRELAARIRAQLRQANTARTTRLVGAGIDVDLLARTACHHGNAMHLTTIEFRLLAYLMRYPGVTHSRQDIFREVWGQDSGPRNRVDVYVGFLRRKLRDHDPLGDMPIETVFSQGYRFVDGNADAPANAGQI